MSNMRVVENSPAKLVLEKSFTAVEIWRERGRSFVNPLVLLGVLYIGVYIYSSNNLSSPTRSYWVVGIGVAIAEIIALYAVLYAERKITITIDMHSKVASRNIIFISGKEQKSETALGNVSRVVLHHYNEQRGSQLKLEMSDQSNFIIATYPDFPSDDSLVEALQSLESLGKKIGELLQKPVVKKLTEVDVDETVISEDVIQPYSRVVQNALKYVNEAYAFMLKQGYEVFSAKEMPMGWQIILRKQDLFVRILQMRGDEDVHFQKTSQPPDDFGLGYSGSDEFVDIGSVVYAGTGEKIPLSYSGYSKELQKHLDKIEKYFKSEYITNKDSLLAAQKEYRETLSPKEEISAKELQRWPILYYPLKVIIMLLLFGALTTLYAVLLERLSSAFSLDLGSYGILMLAVSVLLAIGTMLSIRRKMG